MTKVNPDVMLGQNYTYRSIVSQHGILFVYSEATMADLELDFSLTSEEEQFRKEVQRFVAEEPPSKFPTQTENECFGFGCWSYEFTRRVGQKGWIGTTYPREYGGLGLSPIYQFILNEELAYHKAPWAGHFFAYTVGQALIKKGTEAQKRSFLPRLASGEIQFWQALSEPDAGSDLLNCRTRAVLKGDRYCITGQKTWGSRAHRANHAWLLASTRPDLRQKGLSLFLVDMKTPGMTLRPIVNLAGDAAFYELYLDSVEVPKENLIGGENSALQIVIPSLEADRFWARSARIAYCRRVFDDLVGWAKQTRRQDRPVSEDPVFRHGMTALAVDIEIARLLSLRTVYLMASGKALTYEGSATKITADELGRRIAVFARGIVGPASLEADMPSCGDSDVNFGREYIYSIGHGLAGGTFEIQKNTIATRGLGLPVVKAA